MKRAPYIPEKMDALARALAVYVLDPAHAFDVKAREQAVEALRAAGYDGMVRLAAASRPFRPLGVTP